MSETRNGKAAVGPGEPPLRNFTSDPSQVQQVPTEIARNLSKALVAGVNYDRALAHEHFPSAPLDHPGILVDWLEGRPSLLRTVLALKPGPTTESRSYLTWANLDDALSDITWLWEKWLPKGFLTLLAGQPGVGKSTLALVIGHCVVSSRCWPDGTPSPDPAKIVWVEAESSPKLNINRAKSFGIPLNRIIVPGQDQDKAVANLQLDRDEDWKKLDEAVRIPGVELVIVDSLRGAFRGDENSSQCAAFLEKLAELGREHDLAVIVVHHLRKKGMFDGNTIDIDRVRGSTAIVQVARVVWGVDRPDPQDEERARMYMVKNNLSPKVEPIGFTIWDHGIRFGDDPTIEESKEALEHVSEFLLKFLADGPKPSEVVKQKVEELGFSESTLNRARKHLKIEAKKPGNHWTMALPGKKKASDG